jgi:benzil reductase ((S)-benzoin forming)
MQGIYIITGTSRGIGAAVAAHLLQTGNRVIGISRSPSALAGTPGFHEVRASVTDAAWIGSTFGAVETMLSEHAVGMLCLFNNAAIVEPLGAIETCAADAIARHVAVNLTAPIQLTARFMAHFADLELRRKVVFMTSGAAHSAFPDMALYCTSKAGISMFSECVGSEQQGKANGFEVAAINPGMVETDMQETARGMDPDAFRPSDMFRGARASGVVRDVESAARTICAILEARTDMGKTVSVSEWGR